MCLYAMRKKALISPKIYAVISSYNRGEAIRPTIESLLKQTHPLEKIILIDDGSEKGKQIPNIKNKKIERILLEKNVGVVWGRNLGLAMSSGADYVLLVDDDIVLALDAVQLLFEALVSRADAAATMPVVSFLSNKKKVWSAGSGVNLLTGQTMFFTESPANDVMEIPAATSVFLVSMDTVRNVGWYDPLYYFCYEDADFYYRLTSGGKHIYCVKAAVAYHDIPQSLSLDRVSRRSYHIARGRVLFLYRHSAWFPLNLLFVFAFSFYYVYLGIKFKMFASGLRFWQGMVDALLLILQGKAQPSEQTMYRSNLAITEMLSPQRLKNVKVRQ